MDEKRKNDDPLGLDMIITVFVMSALFGGIVIFSALYFWLHRPPQSFYMEGNPQGVRELRHPRELVDFELLATTGDMVSLSEFEGEAVMLFFGYTHCPDVCLTTLADVRQVHELLGDSADEVSFVFVGVDPARDTPERMQALFNTFRVGDFTIGLQGDDLTLERISADYSLFYQRHEDEGEYYSVDHTASMYLISPDGELDTIFAYGTLPELIAGHILETFD